MNRRTFLQRSAVAASAAYVSGLSPIFASPMGLPVGIQLYAVHQALATDPAGTLGKLHEIGYRQVETAGFAGKSAEEFRKLLEGAGLECPSAHLQLTEAGAAAAFAEAHTLGAKYATSSSLWHMMAESKDKGAPEGDDFKRIAARMNELGREAKASGLRYAYHNHNYEFTRQTDGSYGYDTLLRETDPALVFFEADCGWFSVAGADPVHYMETSPHRFKMLHIKDFKPVAKPSTSLGGPDRPSGIELGRGFVQYRRIFEAGKKAGIEYAFAEQEAPFEHSELESAAVDYKFLQSFS